jgi:23S rRNA (guanosine2251-2'-O)-methyltransferase
MNEDTIVIYGKHPVIEALSARPDVVTAVYTVNGGEGDVIEILKKHGIPSKILNPKKLPLGVSRDAVHQGFVAEINMGKLVVDYDDFMRGLSITNDTAVAILGEIQDPHNVGAIIRSAAGFGIAAVMIPGHRQAQVTSTVIKVSVGTAFRIPLVSIKNVNNTIADLKEKGFWVYGLAGEAEQSVTDEQFEKPSVIVLGNEGDGIRMKTLEHCDIPLQIPMVKNVESFNASVAAGIVFYAWSTKHPDARK